MHQCIGHGFGVLQILWFVGVIPLVREWIKLTKNYWFAFDALANIITLIYVWICVHTNFHCLLMIYLCVLNCSGISLEGDRNSISTLKCKITTRYMDIFRPKTIRGRLSNILYNLAWVCYEFEILFSVLNLARNHPIDTRQFHKNKWLCHFSNFLHPSWYIAPYPTRHS